MVLVQYLFLGDGKATLSMLFEILKEKAIDFETVRIVPNLTTEEGEGEGKEKIPYLPQGIKEVPIISHKGSEFKMSVCQISQSEYQPSEESEFKIYIGTWLPTLRPSFYLGALQVNNKKQIYNFFWHNYQLTRSAYGNLIDPRTSIASSCQLGQGVVVQAGVTLAPYGQLGDFVTINRNASIGHHTRIGDWTTINPGVHVGGFVKIEPGVTLGLGVIVLEKISIGTGTIVGAGAVVTQSLPPGVVAYGTPAKVIRPVDN